jgi:hypothetical protein
LISTGITNKLSKISILPRNTFTTDDVFAGSDQGVPKEKATNQARNQSGPSKATGTETGSANISRGGRGRGGGRWVAPLQGQIRSPRLMATSEKLEQKQFPLQNYKPSKVTAGSRQCVRNRLLVLRSRMMTGNTITFQR